MVKEGRKEGRNQGSLSETVTIDDYERSSVRKGSEEEFNGTTNKVTTFITIINVIRVNWGNSAYHDYST